MDLVIPDHGLWIWQLGSLVYLGFWVYALIDCQRNDFQGHHQKLIWMILILFAPIFGTFIYLSMGKSSKIKKSFRPDFSQISNKTIP
ncbi:MAG: PLD nuclease N-terminal domain-containing protein [Cyclobacteriaceae bacterium]|nr:PLD nuclease N-terminal domain-containing protein [Cyclobacteriaceae bacterium]MDX5467893.1 PLD nuclease N-terminal domain-containing protein [Cyclobacteriaceae bacterium]